MSLDGVGSVRRHRLKLGVPDRRRPPRHHERFTLRWRREQVLNHRQLEVIGLPFRRLLDRRALISSAAGAMTLFGAGLDRPNVAARRKKRKQKPLQRNEFGCVPVGKPCRGRDDVCCSGICNGRKPKKGEKDKSRCAAHDSGGCQNGQTGNACISSEGNPGHCETTTGNAGYCAGAISLCSLTEPICQTDADCQDVDPRAACLRNDSCTTGTICAIP